MPLAHEEPGAMSSASVGVLGQSHVDAVERLAYIGEATDSPTEPEARAGVTHLPHA